MIYRRYYYESRKRWKRKQVDPKEFHSAKLFKNEIGTWVAFIVVAVVVVAIIR